MSDEDFLLLSSLNAWEYCPRRFYLEYVLGEMQQNEHIVWGRYLHELVNEGGVERHDDVLLRRQQWVWSNRLGIYGLIDLVEEKDGLLVPVEYKKGKMNRHINDHIQLCAAGLCLEEMTGKRVDWGAIFYHGNRRRERVSFTTVLRELTEKSIDQARLMSRSKSIPAPIKKKSKCRDCSLLSICLPDEVLLLRSESV
ncbi:MAG: CRISPR-associated protein Cas4 [Pseudanabaenaceae cyanobacterium SKYGB_i_bin29]|nr:CRISPR-associated protein Cas4 [Pseudanabaenaceae cyanobacterium SKYG29]MDW8420997.1 CRISPR-associated protein Cas4 [Pseudanabaenaceae cyanobacterium SKYGB_i_bin29]